MTSDSTQRRAGRPVTVPAHSPHAALLKRMNLRHMGSIPADPTTGTPALTLVYGNLHGARWQRNPDGGCVVMLPETANREEVGDYLRQAMALTAERGHCEGPETVSLRQRG